MKFKLFVIPFLLVTLPSKAGDANKTNQNITNIQKQHDDTARNTIRNMQREAPQPKPAGGSPSGNSGAHR